MASAGTREQDLNSPSPDGPEPGGGSDPSARELRETVDALRAALEEQAADHRAALQHAIQGAAEEIAQLRELVTSLRVALDDAVLDRTEAVADVARAFAQERNELTATIDELRRRLEAAQ